MPKLTFTPIYEGADIEAVHLGTIEVGRLSRRGRSGRDDGRASWIFWLPGQTGRGYSEWREERSYLAARNVLASRVAAWLKAAGLDQPTSAPTPAAIQTHPADDPPAAPATQPDLFGETHV